MEAGMHYKDYYTDKKWNQVLGRQARDLLSAVKHTAFGVKKKEKMGKGERGMDRT